LARGTHVPEQAPPLHKLAHGAPGTQAPFASHVRGVKPSQSLVSGVQAPEQTPPEHAYWHVSTLVVVTRSTPHSNRSKPLQKMNPPCLPSQPLLIGWHVPAFAPGVVSQLSFPVHVPFARQVPPVHTTLLCPACAVHA
jgi:hypothetical protein